MAQEAGSVSVFQSGRVIPGRDEATIPSGGGRGVSSTSRDSHPHLPLPTARCQQSSGYGLDTELTTEREEEESLIAVSQLDSSIANICFRSSMWGSGFTAREQNQLNPDPAN
ncbi:unnamed protein product [Boreogadus saida]